MNDPNLYPDSMEVDAEIIADLRAQLGRIRAETIEECARVVETRMRRSDGLVWVQIHEDIINAIRALKEKS